MSDVISTDTRYYPSKDVCAKFDISGSTLRKWCLALEKNNYEFTRTEQNRRLFVESDLEALEHLQVLVKEKNMSLENAAIIVASRYSNSVTRSSTGTPAHNDEVVSHEVIEQLNEHIKRQEQFNQELLKRLDEQNKFINNSLEQRDKMLMETMNRLTEQRKEEIKLLEQATEQKESWFKKIFKKS